MHVCTWEVYDDLQGDYALNLLSFTVFAICGTHYTMLLYSNRTWPQEQTQRNISEQIKQANSSHPLELCNVKPVSSAGVSSKRMGGRECFFTQHGI